MRNDDGLPSLQLPGGKTGHARSPHNHGSDNSRDNLQKRHWAAD